MQEKISIPNIAKDLAEFYKESEVSITVYPDKVELRPLNNEEMLPALMSEEVLAESWNNPEEDEAWKDL